jgi:hypothetical protein
MRPNVGVQQRPQGLSFLLSNASKHSAGVRGQHRIQQNRCNPQEQNRLLYSGWDSRHTFQATQKWAGQRRGTLRGQRWHLQDDGGGELRR